MKTITRLLATAALLFGVVGGVSSVKAADPTSAEYDAASTAITDGGLYRITTTVNRTTYYLTTTGTLTDARANGGLFTFTKSTPASEYLYENGWDLGYKFTNPDGDGWAYTTFKNVGYIRSSANDNRDTWERQVFFMNATTGKFAVRATNANGSAWGANSYWCVDDASIPTAGYSNDPAYIWELKQVETIEKTTPLLLLKNGSINTTDFDITPTGTSTLTTDNLYSATFTSKANTKNVFQYQNLDVSSYDKAVIKYSITGSADTDEWKINKPSGLANLTIGENQTCEIDLSSTTTYSDFTVFSSWEHHTVGSSITISEVYLYAANYINDTKPVLEFDEFGKATISKNYLTATGGLTYNASTGALSSDGTEGSLVLEFDNPVDLKYLFQFNVTQSGSPSDILDKLEFYDEDGSLINTWNSIKLGNTWNANGIDDAATNAFLNHKPVKKMVWPSAEAESKNGKTATITSVEFILKTISCSIAGETQLKTLVWNLIDDSGTETPTWNMNVITDTYYGNSSSDATHYVDLTAYDELRIYRDNNDGFRAFFINSAGNGTNTINNATWNSTDKYWSINLSNIEKWNGKVALKSIKSSSFGVYNIVKNIVVYTTPAANAPQYTLTGSGMQLAATVAALADATVTSIDATGVTGITTNSEAGRTLLTSANPNCLFLGTTGNGGLANTQNVVNESTCASLVLSDGNYPFKAPSDFTATAASYNRSFTAGQASTICLPFALTAEEVAAAGTFYELTAYSAGTLTFTEVTETEAYKPYLFKAKSANPFSSYSGKTIGATPADLSVTVGDATMTGTMARQSVNGKYGWNSASGDFSKATSDAVTIDPFRAYITIDGNEARMATLFIDKSATGIKEVSEAQSLQNNVGKFFENGKIVIYKKGMKFNANGQQIK